MIRSAGMDMLAALAPSLPVPLRDAAMPLADDDANLESIIEEANLARASGLGFDVAVADEATWPALAAFHRDLKDALFVELPGDWVQWIEGVQAGAANPEETDAIRSWMQTLVQQAQLRGDPPAAGGAHEVERATAFAELLLFETVRLRLLLTAWSSSEYESLGGDDHAIDVIAWHEVDAVLDSPEFGDANEARLDQVMLASASIMLSADAMERAISLEHAHEDTREHLRMQGRLRAALRELRLPESRLLENALSNLLDTQRREVTDLQAMHPTALAGLSRQAMDQRVSRGRRALTKDPSTWPARRAPALYDLFRPTVHA